MRVPCGFLAVFGAVGLSAMVRADASGPVVTRLTVTGHQDRAEVVVDGSFGVPDYSIRSSDDGKRVVLEVAGASLAQGGAEIRGSSALVTRTAASTTARGVRVEVWLSRPGAYRARYDSGQIRVHLEASTPSGTGRKPRSQGAADKGPLTVRQVSIERRDGGERVVVDMSRPASFRVVPGAGGPAKLVIRGARLGRRVQPTVSGDAKSVVRSVRVEQAPDRVFVVAERSPGSSATAIREGNRIVWLFSSARPSLGQTRASRTIAKEPAVEIEGDQVAAFLSQVPTQISIGSKRPRYSGRRIDLDFKDADIHNILRLMSEVGNVNVVTSDDVQGSVTIRMRNVPWDQALDVILQAKGLGKVRRGNLIRVAPLDKLEKEREMAIARRKQRVELAPLETRLIPVSYATAGTLSARVKEMLSERGSVSVDDRTNILVVRDVTETLSDVEELVRSLDSQTPQVLIEARIVEATSQFQREVGIQWGGDLTASSATGNPTGLVFPYDMAVAGGAYTPESPTAGLSPFSARVPNPNFAVDLPAAVGTGEGGSLGLSLGSIGGNVNLNVRLSAAESSGVVRIISSPRILTLDNHQAQIAQGTLIPYSQVSAQGVQTAFQEAKLQLQVTPHVTSDGAVSMDLKITRDEPDFNQRSARGDPTILKREARTSLLVQDNHTAVIGGIYTRNTGSGVHQVPFFGDIPIVGILFKNRSQRDQRNELLIFLTPRIVNRAAALRR